MLHPMLASWLATVAALSSVPQAPAPLSLGPKGATHSDSTTVVVVVQRFHEALARGDSATVLALLHPDAVILEGGAVENREEYRSGHLAADIDYLKSVRMERGPIDVTVIGDAAWARSTSTTERMVQEQVRRGVGAELMVLSKGENGWRIRAIHWSSGRAP